jgi:hypothetical protein
MWPMKHFTIHWNRKMIKRHLTQKKKFELDIKGKCIFSNLDFLKNFHLKNMDLPHNILQPYK